MVNKRRKGNRRDWPSHLHERGGYYSWRHPKTGREYGLGRDKRAAFIQAIEANAHVNDEQIKASLLERLTTNSELTFNDWATRYMREVENRDVRSETKKQTERYVKKLLGFWDGKNIKAITTKHIADVIQLYRAHGKNRTAQSMRSIMLDIFREAVAAGWLQVNPVEATKAPRVTVARARITLEQLLEIHKYAQHNSPWWLPRAIEIALLTGQRREDIRNMGPLSVQDGYLRVEQGKTGSRVAIPLGIHLSACGWTLANTLEMCRSRHTLTRHFLFHRARVGKAIPGSAIRPQTISGEFSAARDAVGIDWGNKTPASFHEIRSLSARLFADERGKDFAQALLGHKSADMAALYRDDRGAEWVKIPSP